MKELRLISTMVNQDHINIVLRELCGVKDIEGAVVELGCNIGTTSIFIQDYLNGSKEYHVYDSFEGLPDKHEYDIGVEYRYKFEKGYCAVKENRFKGTFKEFDLPLPFIHKGWFKDSEYPDKISFAFFDSDFYTSILDSFEKVYPKLVKGGVICVHDYDWDVLPGAKRACDEFLRDRPEKMIFDNYIGIIKKL
jgi:O-methyltransferase